MSVWSKIEQMWGEQRSGREPTHNRKPQLREGKLKEVGMGDAWKEGGKMATKMEIGR